MQAAVDRVIRSFFPKQPMSDEQRPFLPDGSEERGATQLAAQLLQNYRSQLAQRSANIDSSQQG